MKNVAKKLAIIIMAIAMVLSAVALVACGGDDEPTVKNGYTVKVVGIDGQPYTTARVQPCEVGADGNLSQCYNVFVATDAQGVAFLEIGKDIENANADLMEMHLDGLPLYLTYQPVRMRKGETVTITLTENLSNPEGGTGVGVFDPLSETADIENSSPYLVKPDNAYRLKFTSADQKIYYAFRTDDEAVYKVYSVGNVDAAVTLLLGTAMSGIRKSTEAEFTNDNISATDKNFSYEFEVTPGLIEQCEYPEGIGTCYFEVELKNASDVGKDAIIVFEYVDEYKAPQNPGTVNVTPEKPLTPLTGHEGDYVEFAYYDDTATYNKGNDGYYYVGNAVLYATLGNDVITPNGLALSFLNLSETQSLTFRDGDVDKNYLPLVQAYTEAANDEGRYPLTDELIEFFAAYIENTNFASWMQDMFGTTLPEGKEWLVWCGYYRVPAGTEDDPFTLTGSELTVKVPASGKVYYLLTRWVPTIVEITSASNNVSLKCFANYESETDAVAVTSGANGFSHTIEADAYTMYFVVFSTKNGQADTYTITLAEEDNEPDGSEEKPFTADSGWTYGETVEMDGTNVKPVYYKYTTSEADEKLYFYVDDVTVILSIQYEAGGTTQSKSFADVANGLAVPEGTVLTIKVATAEEPGSLKFAIYNAPLGSEDNPYLLEGDSITVVVPAGGTVYYKAFPYTAVTYTLSSTSTNVKLTSYAPGTELANATVTQSDANGFSFSIELEEFEAYILAFSTKDAAAGTYTVTIQEEFPPAPEGSEENPISITASGSYTNHVENMFSDIYYTYTVGSSSEVLSFDWDDDTKITVMVNGKYYSSMDDGDVDDMKSGITVAAGTTITIIVGMTDTGSGDVSFEFSNGSAN